MGVFGGGVAGWLLSTNRPCGQATVAAWPHSLSKKSKSGNFAGEIVSSGENCMATKKRSMESLLRGLSKGSTYRLDPETALELEVYGVIKKYGSKKQILEDSLKLYFKKHTIPSRLRQAAIMILEEGV